MTLKVIIAVGSAWFVQNALSALFYRQYLVYLFCVLLGGDCNGERRFIS